MNEAMLSVIANLDVDAGILEHNAQIAMNEGRGEDVARLSEEAKATRQAIALLGGQ